MGGRTLRNTFAFLSFLCAAMRLSGLSFPSEWSFGFTDDANRLMKSITVLNDEEVSLSLGFVSLCGCLTVDPSVLTLRPGESAVVTLVLDPAGRSGSVRIPVLVRVEGRRDRQILVQGTVVSANATARVPASGRDCALCPELPVILRFYSSADCASCQRFLDAEAARLSTSLGTEILVNKRDVNSPEVLQELYEILSAHHLSLSNLPVAVVGDAVLQGELAIQRSLASEIEKMLGVSGANGN